MIDKAWKALAAAPTGRVSQKQSCSALKHQIYLFVFAFIILGGDFVAHDKTSLTTVKAD